MSPDDVCGVCGDIRENHGDKNHEFNLNGDLVPKKAPAPPRQNAPKERDPNAKPSGVEELEKSHLRLIEVLIEKKVLDATDVVKILGGSSS